MPLPTDQALVGQAQADPAAFEILYQKYADRIYNYFWYRVSHNQEAAEDLMQDTFLRAFKALPDYQEKGYSYHTYLRTIAHNLLVSYYRLPQSVPLDEAIDIPDEPIRDLADRLDARLVWNAVRDNLTPGEKDIVLMFYQNDMPVKDIAVVTGKSPNAVKLQLSRARKKLQQDVRLASLRDFRDVSRPYNSPPRFLPGHK